ncbi:AI-2E family transporter [Alkaliphilus peptidifermentans]|uniref:Predicted PurR-regulated permease PerM n=1 Tax=Alkaliphilus peptidifermentans DSM 18978 TaxID=1120976 RepID=A0A1G5II12_9FIRM|nr:AI-2E family transporter [Alkaliphilus peptidifermentans]SCY75607.1 Predicted PurR-regulated permease PerM [Alkaliphilus peptidifermentans DSM 18978]
MNTKIIKTGQGILLLFLIIYIASLIDWVFRPLVVVFETLYIPIILSGFLYYLLRPLVNILNKKLERTISILLVYLILVAVLIGLLIIIFPILQRQFYSLTDNMPLIISDVQRRFVSIQQGETLQRYQLSGSLNIEGLILQLGDFVNQLGKSLAINMANFIGMLANTVLSLVIVPFTLFYMLKDGEKLSKYILSIFNESQREDVILIFRDIDKTLSSYIQGQGIVCLCVGALCYVAFLVVGLNYALLLAVIAGITNIIPYFGPWIGTIPAVIVGLFQSPVIALIIVITVIIIQQIESNLIAPQVIGKRLEIHPITIMFLILIVGRLVGLIGMILAVPIFAICKVIVTRGIQIWKLKSKEKF